MSYDCLTYYDVDRSWDCNYLLHICLNMFALLVPLSLRVVCFFLLNVADSGWYLTKQKKMVIPGFEILNETIWTHQQLNYFQRSSPKATKMKSFATIDTNYNVINYCCKALHLRYLSEFWLRLWHYPEILSDFSTFTFIFIIQQDR